MPCPSGERWRTSYSSLNQLRRRNAALSCGVRLHCVRTHSQQTKLSCHCVSRAMHGRFHHRHLVRGALSHSGCTLASWSGRRQNRVLVRAGVVERDSLALPHHATRFTVVDTLEHHRRDGHVRRVTVSDDQSGRPSNSNVLLDAIGRQKRRSDLCAGWRRAARRASRTGAKRCRRVECGARKRRVPENRAARSGTTSDTPIANAGPSRMR